jgi:hypothetical protein
MPRQRFLATVGFKKCDFPFVRAIGGWPETRERWKNEGWDGKPLEEMMAE